MAGRYEIRLRGRVTPAMLSAFTELGLEPEATEVVYTGPVADQAALRTIVEHFLGSGAEIVGSSGSSRTAASPSGQRSGA